MNGNRVAADKHLPLDTSVPADTIAILITTQSHHNRVVGFWLPKRAWTPGKDSTCGALGSGPIDLNWRP